MPFKIIRNDITKVKADAVVNTANPRPTYASGTDAAIYEAAGPEELLRERKKIGFIARGEAVVTSGFALPAKYIIHTVGPSWINGKHGELETLESCYRNSLILAESLGCQSIAFPLISAGVYRFPKDQALNTAVSVIREFLESSEMLVILVVFDRRAFELSAALTEAVDEYIDENYVSEKQQAESRLFPPDLPRRREEDRIGKHPDSEDPAPALYGNTMPEPPAAADPGLLEAGNSGAFSLEEAVGHPGKSFQDRLFELIDESGLTDVEVYKKANISRKVFSSMHKKTYHPKKSTVIAMAMSLKLDLEQTEDLLKRAGFALSPGSVTDLIVRYFISTKNYNIFDLNEALFSHGQPTIGC